MGSEQVSTVDYEALLDQFNNASSVSTREYRIQLVHHSRHLVLRIEGKVNQHSFQNLAGQIKSLLAMKRMDALVIDLSLCEYVASAAIGFMAFTIMEYQRMNGRIYVIKANPSITKMFKVLGLEGLYENVDSIDAIIADG